MYLNSGHLNHCTTVLLWRIIRLPLQAQIAYSLDLKSIQHEESGVNHNLP